MWQSRIKYLIFKETLAGVRQNINIYFIIQKGIRNIFHDQRAELSYGKVKMILMSQNFLFAMHAISGWNCCHSMQCVFSTLKAGKSFYFCLLFCVKWKLAVIAPVVCFVWYISLNRSHGYETKTSPLLECC